LAGYAGHWRPEVVRAKTNASPIAQAIRFHAYRLRPRGAQRRPSNRVTAALHETILGLLIS